MSEDEKWLLDLVEKEKEKLMPVIGSCNSGKLEIRAFLMERFLEALKSDPEFNQEVYDTLNEVLCWKTYRTTACEGEDGEAVKRMLEVAAMMDKVN